VVLVGPAEEADREAGVVPDADRARALLGLERLGERLARLGAADVAEDEDRAEDDAVARRVRLALLLLRLGVLRDRHLLLVGVDERLHGRLAELDERLARRLGD